MKEKKNYERMDEDVDGKTVNMYIVERRKIRKFPTIFLIVWFRIMKPTP
jgi:hypothetical protein